MRTVYISYFTVKNINFEKQFYSPIFSNISLFYGKCSKILNTS